MSTLDVLFFETKQAAIDAELKIRANCGIPSTNGTACWSEITKFENGYYIQCPTENGWNGIEKSKMLEGVSGDVVDIEILVFEDDI